jgi:hypothetical protein
LKRTSNSPGVVKYATQASGDAVWEIRSVDTVTKLMFGFIGARNITDVAYSDEKLLRLAVWDGSEWRIDTVVDAGSATLGQLVSLALDFQDRPHIAYFEVTDKSPLDGVVKYAFGTRATSLAGDAGS